MTYIEQAVVAVGNKGRYQKILMGFLILCYIELGLMLFGSTFIFMNPEFDCPGLVNPSEADACAIIDQCRIINDYTATAYGNLYCDNQTERSIIQSSVYIGAILGLLVLTPFADQKGKKKMFMIAIAICISGISLNLIGIFSGVVPIIILGQILVGAGAYCILIVGYVILGELSEDKFKQVGIITLNAVWALAEVTIGVLYFCYNQWHNYLILFTLIPMVGLLLFGLFFLVESPYYLLEKQKNIKKAMKSMEQIALINKVNLSVLDEVESNFHLVLNSMQEQSSASKDGEQSWASKDEEQSRFAIFKDSKYLRLLLLVTVCQIGINVFYYGIQFSLGKIGTNFGSNILLMGVIEFSAFFSFNFVITKLPRRKGIIIFNIVCVILGLLFIFDMPLVVQTIILGFGRWFNAYSMGIIPMLQSEPFPHKYRSSVWGYIEGLSQLGNFVTPFIVTACENANIPTLMVTGVICGVLGLVPMIFVKQTLGLSEDEINNQDHLQHRQQTGLSINAEDQDSLQKSLKSS